MQKLSPVSPLQTGEDNQKVHEFTGKFFGFFKKYWYFIIIGLILALSLLFRFETYILDRQLWFDEIALAVNFFEHSGFFWVFHHLNHCQVAPPLFLGCVKFLITVFGKSDMVFRFLPFLASVLSVPVFYILSKMLLKSKTAIIFANFLFAINFSLIFYGSEFKQYSSDVLIFMLTLLWLSKQNLQNIGFVRVLKYTLIFSILFLFSQPTIFLLFGFFIFNFLKNPKNLKNYLIPILPIAIAIFYKISMPHSLSTVMAEYWRFAFISPDTFIGILKENLNFFFLHIKCLKFLSPLILIGFIIFVLNKKTPIARILLLSFLGCILANILHFYPCVQRLILFTFPFVTIFIAACFDFEFKSNKINKILLPSVIFFVFLFLMLFQMGIICKERTNKALGLITVRDISLILKENFNNNEDILIIPSSNKIYYDYYSNVLDIDINKNNIVAINDIKNLDTVLNKIDNKKSCWIFLTSDYTLEPSEAFVSKYLKSNSNIIVLYKISFTALKHYPSSLYKIRFKG